MVDLVVRPSGLPEPENWSLQLRYYDSFGPAEYYTLTYVDRMTAIKIMEAGACVALFQHPLRYDTEKLDNNYEPSTISLAVVEADETQVFSLNAPSSLQPVAPQSVSNSGNIQPATHISPHALGSLYNYVENIP